MKEILEVAKRMKNEGYYLITITAVDLRDYFEIIYHFSKDNDIKSFRFLVKKGEEVPSISEIFPNAYIHEWEEFETMGVKFKGSKKIFGD